MATARVGGRPNADHVLVRNWANRLGGDGIPVTFYADLPYSLRAGVADWVAELDFPGAHRIELTDGQIERKLDALRRYETQWAGLVGNWNLRDGIALDHPSAWRYEAMADRPGNSA
jgi:hypothetical protein